MEKSIETIWKEGFNAKKEFVPQVNDLQSQKSKDIVDRMTKSMKINTALLVVFSFGFLLFTYFSNAPILFGIVIFLIFNSFAIYNWKQIVNSKKIDKTINSYEYLIKFDNLLKRLIQLNMNLNRFIYPLCLLIASIILWFSYGREALMDKLLLKFPDTNLIEGVPIFFIIAILITSILLSFFSSKIYKWEVNLFFGRLIEELEETIADIESLKP